MGYVLFGSSCVGLTELGADSDHRTHRARWMLRGRRYRLRLSAGPLLHVRQQLSPHSPFPETARPAIPHHHRSVLSSPLDSERKPTRSVSQASSSSRSHWRSGRSGSNTTRPTNTQVCTPLTPSSSPPLSLFLHVRLPPSPSPRCPLNSDPTGSTKRGGETASPVPSLATDRPRFRRRSRSGAV